MLGNSSNSVTIYYPGIGHMDICLGGTIADTDAATNLMRLNNDCMTFIESLV